MKKNSITLELLKESDRNQFIKDNQWAFKYGAMEEFGCRDNHFEEDGEIISRETIEYSIDEGVAYRILADNRIVGGAVVKIEGDRGDLELLFVHPNEHTKGIGQGAWFALETMYPQVKVWQTCTPYFEKRNIHFYVNKCGFHIVEFFNRFHPEPNTYNVETSMELQSEKEFEGEDGMFRFEKVIVS